MSNGTTISIGDTAGEINMEHPGRTAIDERRFCLTCHTTSGSGLGWNGTTTQAVIASDYLEGISRLSTSGRLRLPDVNGHRDTDGQSCYLCHGNSYVDATSNNVHNPGAGISNGGQECYDCHSAYRPMDAADVAKTASYHHVMGTSTLAYTGGMAPNTGSYPTSTTDLFCASCHTDHNYFNAAKGANLRIAISDASGANATNTDFIDGGSYGICLSCHTASLGKDRTNQASVTDPTTRTVSVVATAYAGSAHDYSVTSSYGAAASDVFRANCSKCHNDEQTKDYQSSTYRFGTHSSAARRILSGFGQDPVTDPMGEDSCFHCHTTVGSGVNGVFKPLARRDVYGAAGSVMTTLSETVYESLTAWNSSHPVGAQVLCENCHNPHAVSDTTRTSDPDNTAVGLGYGSTGQKVTFCLRCHDGSAPVYVNGNVSGSYTYVPGTVTIDPGDAADANKSAYGARGHWTANGSIGSAETKACDACHDNHGSNAPKLLGSFDATAEMNMVNGVQVFSNNNSICYACHAAASTGFPYAPFSRTASGYPSDGTWPGQTTYTVVYTVRAHGLCPHERWHGLAGERLRGRRLQELPRRAWHRAHL